MENFICKINYLKQLENGTVAKATDQYVVDALSFTECEANLQSHLEEYIPEYNLMAMAKSDINDVIVDESKDLFIKTTVEYVSSDADSGKEKKITEKYLIQADTVKEAIKKAEERMEGSVVNWSIKGSVVTPILEYFQVPVTA